jgi:erlin
LKEAEVNRLKLTPEYLELRFIESIANNSKIFFGEKVLNAYTLFSSPYVSETLG